MGVLDNVLATGKQALRLGQQAGAEFALPFMGGAQSPQEQALEAKRQAFVAANPGSLRAALSNATAKLPHLSNPVFAEVMPGALSSLYDIAADKLGLPQSPSYLKGMQTDIGVANDKSNALLHTDNPHDAADVAARAIGGMLLPGPKLAPVAKGAGIGTHAARVGAELLLPGRQGGIGTVAGAAGVGVAAHEAIDTLGRKSGGIPGYTSIADMTVPDQQLQSHPKHTYVDYIKGDDATIYKAALAVGDDDTAAEMEAHAQQLADAENTKAYSLPEPDWKEPALKAAIIATGAAATVFGHGVIKNALANFSPDPNTLMGSVRKGTTIGAGDKFITDNVQHDQPLRSMERDMATTATGKVNQPVLDQHEANLDQVTAPAINSRVHHAVMTGEVGHNTHVTPPIHVAEDYAKLAPPEQQIVAEGLLAHTAFNDYQRTGKASAFHDLGLDPAGVFDAKKYVTELKQRIQLMQSDPKLNDMAARVKDQYKGMLKLKENAGLVDATKARDMAIQRPEYVPVRKNIVDNPTDDLLGNKTNSKPPQNVLFGMMARSTDEAGGVQFHEAANPVHLLFDEWTQGIRNAHVNEARADILSRAAAHPDLGKIIKVIPGKPQNPDLITTVFVNGKPVNYLVNDHVIKQALEMNPFATRGALSALAGVQRKLITWSNTGMGSVAKGYFAPKAAAMDAILGSVLKPKGMHAGMANEMINKLKKPGATGNAFTDAAQSVLSRVDPTGANAIGVLTNIPIGTIRGIHDDLVGHFATSISDSLAHDGILSKMLGPDTMQALEMRAAQAYENTTKAHMMQSGAYGSSIFGNGRPSQLSAGVKEVAPKFSKTMADASLKDAMANGGNIEKALRMSDSVAVRASASTLGKIIHSVNQNIHESYRYQMFAANEGKYLGKGVDFDVKGKPFKTTYVNDEAAKNLIASQVRRIAGDVGQTGGSRLYQELTNAVAYSNVGVQTLAQGGRMLAKQPAHTIFNAATMLTGIAGTYLASLYLDPTTRNRVAAMTPEQRATYVPLTGNLGYDIPQEFRPLVAPLMAMLDEVVGMNDLDENHMPKFNQDFGKSVMHWMDSGMPMSDENKFEYHQMMDAAVKSLNPFGMGSVPGLDTYNAVQGIDAQQTNLTGDPAAIKKQNVSPLGGEGELAGDFISAQAQKVIQSLVGSTIAGWVRPALDAKRALDGGGDAHEAVDMFLSRVKDNALKSPTNLAGQLWSNYDRALPKSSVDSELYYKKVEGMKQLQAIANKDIWGRFVNGKDPRSVVHSVQDVVPPQLMGTAAGTIAMRTVEVQKATAILSDRIYKLNQRMEEIDNLSHAPIQERNRQKNEVLSERLELQQRLNNIYSREEENIRTIIGDPTFTYQNMDAKKYANMPLPPAPVP